MLSGRGSVAEAVPSLLPPLGNDYVVVPDGGAEKVVRESGCVHQYLRSAKAIIVLVFKNFHIFKEHFRAIRREFEYPCGSGGQHSVDRHADSRLEVGVVGIFLHHVQWNGAVGEQHLVAVDA